MWIETVVFFIPELILIVAAVGIYLAGCWIADRQIWSLVASAAIVMAFLALVMGEPFRAAQSGEYWSLPGPLSSDALGFFGRAMALSVGLLLVLASARNASGPLAPEFFGTLLLLLTGLMIVSSSRDLVTMFLGLELITIPTYILLYLARKTSPTDTSGQEAAVKYFYLSVFAAAIMLYGFSFLYGAGGSTELAKIHARLSAPDVSDGTVRLAQLGMALAFAGLAFKITAVPFHFYAPDVYQATSNNATALLAVIPKVAGFMALVRILSLSLPGLEPWGWRLAWVLAIGTMTWGNLLALWQDNLRRMLAYSSIAHSGYVLLGFTLSFAAFTNHETGGFDPLAAVFFYLALYAAATVGFFATLTYLGQQDREVSTVDELAGLSRTQPLAALAMAIFLFSMAGIPPLAGFWGKLMLFGSATHVAVSGAADGPTVLGLSQPVAAGVLAIVGVLNAAIAAAYYLRIIGAMYFRPPVGQPAAEGGLGAAAAGLVCAALVLGIGCFPGPVRYAASMAASGARKAVGKQDWFEVQASAPAKTAPAAGTSVPSVAAR